MHLSNRAKEILSRVGLDFSRHTVAFSSVPSTSRSRSVDNGEFSDFLILASGVPNPRRKLCEKLCEKQRAETDGSRRLYGHFVGCRLHGGIRKISIIIWRS